MKKIQILCGIVLVAILLLGGGMTAQANTCERSSGALTFQNLENCRIPAPNTVSQNRARHQATITSTSRMYSRTSGRATVGAISRNGITTSRSSGVGPGWEASAGVVRNVFRVSTSATWWN